MEKNELPFMSYEKISGNNSYRCDISNLTFFILPDNIVNTLENNRYVYTKLKSEEGEEDFFIRVSSVFKKDEIDLTSFTQLFVLQPNDLYVKFTDKKQLAKFKLMYDGKEEIKQEGDI